MLMSVVGVLPEIRESGKPSSAVTCFIILHNNLKWLYITNTTCLRFSLEESVFSSSIDNIHEFRDYLNNDGREPTEYVAKTILICSPQKRYYSTFDKLGTTIRYMPVWSWEEIGTCRNVLFRDLTQKKILNFVDETTEDNSASHKIVHIRTNVPQVDDTGESSSPAVTKQSKDNEGIPFYTLSNLEFASDHVYEKLLNGGPFKVRPLFGKTTSCFGITNRNLKLIIPLRNKLFSKPDEVIQTRYCIPIQKNNASFDAFVSPDTFFQMTTLRVILSSRVAWKNILIRTVI
ncbi:5979_t:CDS:2 [Diversispora eburnea]|uniref:5979_t:CDS:1 n=1 Tax=Diversispora eburnea TaxID=1213867 RepID=A0A9N9C8M4_9GLOM|nr:5979_t:CDS:2 [Diversispora eburnea]